MKTRRRRLWRKECKKFFLEGNEVSKLGLDNEDFLLEAEGYTKWKKDEVALGRIKRQKENEIRPEKSLHLPSASMRTHNPERFYSDDWNEVKQEEEEWQEPDEWQRILQMVFRRGDLEFNPVGCRFISSSVQQEGRCSA